MKKNILILAFLFSVQLFAQEIVLRRTKSYKYNLNFKSVIIDKETGKRINFKDLGELIDKHPNSTVIPKKEDDEGNLTSYYFITDLNNDVVESKSKKVKINRKDVSGELFSLEKIEDKKVLIIVQLDLEFPMINLGRIKEVEESALKREDCISVILTTSSKDQSKQFASEQYLKSIIIPNSSNTIQQFDLKRFPTYIILNKDKSINSELKHHYEVEEVLSKMD